MFRAEEDVVTMEQAHDSEEMIERIAALDIGKATLVCCVRVPADDKPGRRLQDVTTYSTMTRSLMAMADRLRELGVSRVVMEATSDYWKPAFHLLEAQGFDPWLVNARDVKHLPGTAEDRPSRRGLAVQGRRTANDPAQLRATGADPSIA
jgi:transposase